MGDNYKVYACRDDIPYSQVQFEELGRGRFGTVTKVQRKSPPHEIYAMKSIDTRINEVAKIQEEISIVKRIQYIHIVRIIESFQFSRFYAIILDPVADTDLERYIYGKSELEVERKPALISTWIGCLINGLAFLHDEKIRHRDIKPANILIKQENILLADFGIAAISDEKLTTMTDAPRARTEAYCAPEVERGGTRKRLADIYSLGAVFLDMFLFYIGQQERSYILTLRQNLPHVHAERQNLLIDLWNVDLTEPWSLALLYLCENMLKSDRDLRPNASDVRLCWSYVRALTNLSQSCECIEPTKLLNDATISPAGKNLISRALRWWENSTLQIHQTAMHIAAKRGHRNIMEMIIDDGGLDLDSQDGNGKTPLSWAVEEGHASVVQLLLEKGVEFNSDTLLRQAIRKGHSSVALLLLDQLPATQDRQLHADLEKMRTTIDNLIADRDELRTKIQTLERENETLHENLTHERNLAYDVESMRHVIRRLEDDCDRFRKRLHSLDETIELRIPRGDQYFMDNFSELRTLIRRASQEHSAYIPVDPPSEILEMLPRGMPPFLDNTAASRELRAAYIQHHISRILTHRIFYPFQAFNPFQVSSTDIYSNHQEADWRHQTLKAAYSTSDAEEAINALVGIVQDEIVDHIKHFADPRHLDDLILSLRTISKFAAENWRHARIERLLIVANFPSKHGFRDADWDNDWEEYTCGRSVDYRKSSYSSSLILLGLFPEIYRKAAIEDFAHDTEEMRSCVYSGGMVLLSDSPSVLARTHELARKNALP